MIDAKSKMSLVEWRMTLDSFKTPVEKFEFLTGLSELSWNDCCDAWFEAKKLIPEITLYLRQIQTDPDYHRVSQEIAFKAGYQKAIDALRSEEAKGISRWEYSYKYADWLEERAKEGK